MSKRPKEEEIECDIQWGSEKLWTDKTDSGDVLDHVKSDPEEQEAYQSPISNTFTVQVVEYNQDSSITVSTHDAEGEQGYSSSTASAETPSSSPLQSNDTSSSHKQRANPETSIKSVSVNILPWILYI